jgi:hypothetical protein
MDQEHSPGELFSAHNVIKAMKTGTGECPAAAAGYRRVTGSARSAVNPYNRKQRPDCSRQTAKPVFCRKCGKELKVNAKFCTNCGTPRRP